MFNCAIYERSEISAIGARSLDTSSLYFNNKKNYETKIP